MQGCIWEEAENKRKTNINMQLDGLIKKSGRKRNKKIAKKAYDKISLIIKIWFSLYNRKFRIK